MHLHMTHSCLLPIHLQRLAQPHVVRQDAASQRRGPLLCDEVGELAGRAMGYTAVQGESRCWHEHGGRRPGQCSLRGRQGSPPSTTRQRTARTSWPPPARPNAPLTQGHPSPRTRKEAGLPPSPGAAALSTSPRRRISSAASSVPSSTAPPRIARPSPAPRKNPPKTAVSTRSGVTSGNGMNASACGQ